MKTPAFEVFMTLNWEGIQPMYQQLEDIELTEESLDLWMEGWSDLRKLVDERKARLGWQFAWTLLMRKKRSVSMIFWSMFTRP